MTATYDEAVDQIYGLFSDKFTAGAAAIVGYVPDIRWLDDQNPNEPDRSKVWVRISVNPVMRPQTSLSNDVFQPGKKMFTSSGLVYVQLFFPKSYSNAAATMRRLAQFIVSFMSNGKTEGCVWFRNAIAKPVVPEDLFYRSNVVTEYQHDEID